MYNIDHLYIDGAFVRPNGRDIVDIVNPATEQPIGRLTLGDVVDTRAAIAAAARAQPAFARTSKAQRIAMLKRLHEAVLARADELREATIAEYGAPVSRALWVTQYAAQSFLDAALTLERYDFTRTMGTAMVVMEPVGVAALITPWNSAAGSICSKLAMAISAGCACVIKPSEMSALQSQIVAEALHQADLPPGVWNMVNGRGDVVGGELSVNPGVARVSFTGSTAVGKVIVRAGADTMKRVSLALSGKSPVLVLDDADLDHAVPLALNAAFQNNGQACVAGSRLLVPERRLPEVLARLRVLVAEMAVGDPRDPATVIGPLASRAQFERIQRYIRLGVEEGATLIAGGEGRPDGVTQGYFVRPTIFADVRNAMRIASDEIFGPVLCVMSYSNDDDAIAQANDSPYGLQAYVLSSDPPRARAVAARLRAGRVLINSLQHEPLAPFGGVKQSGIGREFGVLGLESFLEAKTVIEAAAP